MASSLRIIIERQIELQPSPNRLALPLARKLGDIRSYKYVHADSLPLRLERKSSNNTSPSSLKLTISQPIGTIEPPLYFISNGLPLLLNTLIENQPSSSSLPLKIERDKGSAVISPTGPTGPTDPTDPTDPDKQSLTAESWASSSAGLPSITVIDKVKIEPTSIDSQEFGTLLVQKNFLEGYLSPNELKLPLSVLIEIRPASHSLSLPMYRKLGQFLNRPNILPTNNSYIYYKGFASSRISINTSFYNYHQFITDVSFDSLQMGGHAIRRQNELVYPAGIQTDTKYGLALIVNSSREVYPPSIESIAIDKPLIYNLKQFAPLQGNNQSSYGIAYLQGGVRWLKGFTIAPLGMGRPALLNTTANQNTRPSGIVSTAVVPAPIVSPHMIYAGGIYSTLFGSIKVVPTPVLRHKGVNHLIAGTPTVWYHTRELGANGFESYHTGYPKAFDPTQFIQQSAFNRTAVFGDTYARNNLTVIRSAGAIDDLAVSQWSLVENRNKPYLVKGFLSQAFGNQSIKNKSPSIFFNGLPAPIFYSQAVGHRIRAIAPTGFDRLGLGKPVVIKTPQLFPRGYIATQFGTQWASNYTRYIENNSKDHGSAGKPTVWFRWRYANPNSWQSSNFDNKTTLTHGVREIIGRGFIQQAYGNAWLSHGVRLLEPLSIVKRQQASNHFVGRHQEIKPIGYIATQFGTRIIPEIQAVYPLGFAGVFGLAFADLAIRYLKPNGYSSAGEQPAFRWGWQIVQNSVQYITQNYDGGNGLVPPKWSEWTAIENRNKVIGAIGTAMQRFGYSQIDNDARLLEPQALIATRIGDGMITYRIRHMLLQGIEQPHISDWLIVHNAARVIKPAGEVQSLFGDAELVNTRRYLDRIGRIESFESGAPMIAYRIRTIDIEKRYSIAPPIIRLPTIDLYTRYIDFRGYETAKYGVASLSIHFRIITPRWTHNEKSGSPALHNVTPELLTRGHDSQDYGNASIRTQWRNVYAQGDSTAAIGLLKISDTKQHISVRGFVDSLASQKHTFIQGESAPYSLQYIYLNDESGINEGNGKGIRPPTNQTPRPYLNQNVIYHRNQSLSSNFGTQFIWSNNLEIESGISVGIVSNGLKVYTTTQTVSLQSKGLDNRVKIGYPRFSPHTIYAVKEAPPQAIRNHPVSGLHYVGQTDYKPAGEIFGKHFIESSIRNIKPSSFFSSRYSVGRPVFDLTTKVVRTNGFRLGRFGVPSIPFSRQDIVMRAGIYISVFGSTIIEKAPHIGPQYIKPNSVYSNTFGITYSGNFIRTLQARGSDSLAMGQRKNNDNPFMWQGLRVGEHVPLIIGGDDTSSHGLTWISLRVRELGAEGFNAFLSEYTLSAFNERMNVSNADKKLPVKLTVKPVAIESSSNIGYQDIKLGQHYIRPDGNSDQFRKGGYHA